MIIDIFFLIVIGYGFYLGFSKGILGTIFGILGFLLALVASFKFAPAATDFLQRAFHTDNPMTFLAGFFAMFLLALWIVRKFVSMIEGGLAKANLSIINQAAGGFLMAALLVFAYSNVVKFAETAHLISEETRYEARTYPLIETFPAKTKVVWEKTKPVFQEFWNESINFLDRMQAMNDEKRKQERKEKSEEDDSGETSIFNVDY